MLFAWVIPYAAFVLVVAIAMARFWRRLPARSRWQFAAAGLTYVGGGIGMEMLGSKLFTIYGWHSLQFDLQTMLEEFLEMFGVALSVCALVGLIQQRSGRLTLVFGTQHDRPLGDLTSDVERDARQWAV
jgi:hypothetical protein